MKVGENRFLCDGAYFYCDTPDIIDCKNGSFVAKAPAAVVEGEKNKLAKYRDTLAGILSALESLK